MKYVILIIAIILLAGCSVGMKAYPGMSRAEVISENGYPDGQRTVDGKTYYIYTDRRVSGWDWTKGNFVVEFYQGSVAGYWWEDTYNNHQVNSNFVYGQINTTATVNTHSNVHIWRH